MASFSISLNQREPVEVHMLTLKTGRSFLVMRITPSSSIYLDGEDQDAIAHARAIATALTDAADALDTKLATPRCACGQLVVEFHLTCGAPACVQAIEVGATS